MHINSRQKFLYKILADFTFLIHLLLVLLVVFGWFFPNLFYFFLVAIIATALSEIFLGYCFLSKIEFGLRKKINPEKHYDKSCIAHYFRVIWGLPPRLEKPVSLNFFKRNKFLFILLALFLVSIFYRLFLQGFIFS